MMTLFLIILYSFSSYAEENTFLQACFVTKKNAYHAAKNLNFLQTKYDRIAVDDKCVDIYTLKRREKVYTNFLRIKYQGYYKLSSSEQVPKKQCRLVVERISLSTNKTKRLSAQKRLSYGEFNSREDKNENLTILISDGQEGQIKVNDLIVAIKCEVRGVGFNLNIRLVGENSSSSTSHFLSRGQKVELASISKNLLRSSKQAVVPSKLVHSKNSSSNSQRVYISIK